jgi:ethanolamine transporter EutH
VARAIDSGVTNVERVDRIIQTIGRHLGMLNPTVDAIVATLDKRISENQRLEDTMARSA